MKKGLAILLWLSALSAGPGPVPGGADGSTVMGVPIPEETMMGVPINVADDETVMGEPIPEATLMGVPLSRSPADIVGLGLLSDQDHEELLKTGSREALDAEQKKTWARIVELRARIAARKAAEKKEKPKRKKRKPPAEQKRKSDPEKKHRKAERRRRREEKEVTEVALQKRIISLLAREPVVPAPDGMDDVFWPEQRKALENEELLQEARAMVAAGNESQAPHHRSRRRRGVRLEQQHDPLPASPQYLEGPQQSGLQPQRQLLSPIQHPASYEAQGGAPLQAVFPPSYMGGMRPPSYALAAPREAVVYGQPQPNRPMLSPLAAQQASEPGFADQIDAIVRQSQQMKPKAPKRGLWDRLRGAVPGVRRK